MRSDSLTKTETWSCANGCRIGRTRIPQFEIAVGDFQEIEIHYQSKDDFESSKHMLIGEIPNPKIFIRQPAKIASVRNIEKFLTKLHLTTPNVEQYLRKNYKLALETNDINSLKIDPSCKITALGGCDFYNLEIWAAIKSARFVLIDSTPHNLTNCKSAGEVIQSALDSTGILSVVGLYSDKDK